MMSAKVMLSVVLDTQTTFFCAKYILERLTKPNGSRQIRSFLPNHFLHYQSKTESNFMKVDPVFFYQEKIEKKSFCWRLRIFEKLGISFLIDYG